MYWFKDYRGWTSVCTICGWRKEIEIVGPFAPLAQLICNVFSGAHAFAHHRETWKIKYVSQYLWNIVKLIFVALGCVLRLCSLVLYPLYWLLSFLFD